MKEKQETRRNSLFAEVEEQRSIYRSQEKLYNEAFNEYQKQKRLFNSDKNNQDYKQQLSKSQSVFCKQRLNSDLALSSLQNKTDNFVKANALNMLDFV